MIDMWLGVTIGSTNGVCGNVVSTVGRIDPTNITFRAFHVRILQSFTCTCTFRGFFD